MRVLYMLTAGTADPTRASLPVHLAVNGSTEVGDDAVLLLAGDGTEFLQAGAIDAAAGVGVPSMRELFDKVRAKEVRVLV
jgi:predicted peroxiredoxin